MNAKRPLRRITKVVCVTGAIIASLLTFPAALPWMVSAWLVWHSIVAFHGGAGWGSLAICFTVVMLKRMDWPASLVTLLVLMAVVTSARAVYRGRAIVPKQRITWAGTAALWIVWMWFALDWAAATRLSRVPRFDPTRSVVCLGDSLTAYGYPTELDRRISVPVVDLGIDGITTADGLKLLEKVKEAEPQVVIIELGGHDYLKGRTRAETADNLRKIIQSCQSEGASVVLMEIPRGFITDPFCGLERQLARQLDLEMITDGAIRNLVLWSPYSPPGIWCGPANQLSDDGLHPNRQGNVYLANLVARRLARLYGQEIVENR